MDGVCIGYISVTIPPPDMKMDRLPSLLLGFCGLSLLVMGFYFIILRPPLLPEDLRYMGVSDTFVIENLPKLAEWLQKVFCVMGGYIATTGIAIFATALRRFPRDRTSLILMAIMGGTSVGWMTYVNFLLHSDFKWLLLSLALIWLVAIIWGWMQMRSSK